MNSLAQVKQIAKQMAREPLEILNDVKEQATGEETSERPDSGLDSSNDQKKLAEQQGKLNDQLKSGRRMEALQREIEDIRKQDKFSDLQKRISEGEEISLEEYPELSMEQKQVLNAQMEAVKVQSTKYSVQSEGLKVPGSKKGRRFGQGQKQEAEKQQTHVEKPVPPSG